MNPFVHLVRIDTWIVEKVELFCHKIQRLTGWTNYSLVSLMDLASVGTLMAIAYSVSLPSFKPSKNHPISILVATFPTLTMIFIGLLLIGAFWLNPYKEKKIYQRLANGLANPEKVGMWPRLNRLLGITLILYFLLSKIINLDLLMIFLLTLIYFLWACDPLPPCQGKIKEKIFAYFAKLQPRKN